MPFNLEVSVYLIMISRTSCKSKSCVNNSWDTSSMLRSSKLINLTFVTWTGTVYVFDALPYSNQINPCRARYSRNRARFVSLPQGLDSRSSNVALVNAALLAGLYPKVLAIDLSSKQMRTISNNQPASFHPSSVNFGRKMTDLGANHLAYFTLMWVAFFLCWFDL